MARLIALTLALSALVACAVSDSVADSADTGAWACGVEAPQMTSATALYGVDDDGPVLSVVTMVTDADGALSQMRFRVWQDDEADGQVDTDREPTWAPIIDGLVDDQETTDACDATGGFPVVLRLSLDKAKRADDVAEVALDVADADGHRSQLVIATVCARGDDRDEDNACGW